MKFTQQHIAFKFIATVLVFTLSLPSLVKVCHSFAHHEHKVCIGEKTTHFHEVDLDCEFQKFQVNNFFTLNTCDISIFHQKEILPKTASQYHYLSDYQRLHFSLRGPPQINLT